MSAYTEQQTQITDADILKECLKEKGYPNVEHNEDAKQLVGYHGDKRQQTAEIILRRSEVNKHSGGASNDIGFKRDANGCFSAIISDYDKHKHDAKWLAELKKSYADKKIRKQAKVAGLTFVKRVEGKDGSFKLQFVKA